ncbi:hypothetical protein [uncultured Alistipes sp.]|uniref:hypothetical protein n=1 Tax=uncultured Alistipes sp. TaxID=538949 RepID=UPI0032B23E20
MAIVEEVVVEPVECRPLAVAGRYLFFGNWQWNVIGIGTLFAMIYVGLVVKFIAPHLGWFDRLLAYRPGFRRYLFGLARFLIVAAERKNKNSRSSQ